MNVLVANLVVIALMMSAVWIVSVIARDASIVDIVWGLGFVVVAWSSWIVSDSTDGTDLAIRVCVTVWGLRLAGYLAWRNLGKGEDYRYQAMRKKYGARFPLISLFSVFLLQGTLMWIVSLPVQLGQSDATPDVGAVAIVGALVYLVGLFFEVVGDAQLARFKADPANAGTVMDRGLWKYTRHPNYFGDACVWWGIAIVAAETGTGAWGLIGAAVMSIFLRRVSGVTLLEKSLKKRRAGYEEYIARTSAFIPRPPRKL